MKKIALLFVLFTIVLSSCNTRSYVVSDLNAVGVVIKKKTVNDWEGSQYKYKVWINPETSVWLVLNDKIEVGDTVYIKSETKTVLYVR